jgi:hypothetical protein
MVVTIPNMISAPIAQMTRLKIPMYFGVELPSGFINPPGRSSSIVAMKPFTSMPVSAMPNTNQKLKSIKNDKPHAIKAAITTPIAVNSQFAFIRPNARVNRQCCEAVLSALNDSLGTGAKERALRT